MPDRKKKQQNTDLVAANGTTSAGSTQEEINFAKARKQVVAKRVDLIQLGRNNLTLVEQKAVNYMISKIKPTDDPMQRYDFSVREFCRMIGWTTRYSTPEMLKMLQELSQKTQWIKDVEYSEYNVIHVGNDGNEYSVKKNTPNVKYTSRHWFDIVELHETAGYITITFSRSITPYLFNLKKQQKDGKVYIASWSVDATAIMKSQYSGKLFEYLKTYQCNNLEWVFENGTGTERDLQVMLAPMDANGNTVVPKGWANWGIFERNVLKPAKEEINKYTDITIDYTPLKVDYAGKKYRRYVMIKFTLIEKNEDEKRRKNALLDQEYNNYTQYEQLSLEDLQYENASEDEKREAKRKEYEKREKEIDKSDFPLLKDMLFDFTEEQLRMLDHAARNHMTEDFSASAAELWVCDFISYYNDYLEATKSETRRSKFARLLAYVRNDYQAYAVQLGTNYIGINESIKQDIPENIVYDIDVDDQVDSSDKIMEENVNYETNDESNSSTANTSTSLEDELLDMVRKAGL